MNIYTPKHRRAIRSSLYLFDKNKNISPIAMGG